MDERLNDGTQEFLGDDVNDLRTHLFQDALHDGFNQRRVRRIRWPRKLAGRGLTAEASAKGARVDSFCRSYG